MPLLVPESNGTVVFHKVLVSMGTAPLARLEGVLTAVAAIDKNPQRAGKEWMKLLAANGFATKGVMVLPVSKDIDALLALSFGQVKAALVTPRSTEVIKRINPTLSQSLRIVHQTKSVLRSPLCVVSGNASSKDVAMVRRAFESITASGGGRQAMALLGYDKWVPFKKSMWRRSK